MRGKAQPDAAAETAQHIADSINGWAALSDLLMQAGPIANAAESATRAELWAAHGPKGLLSPPPPPMPPAAAQHAMIESRKARALRAHREVWSASQPYVWLSAQPGFTKAVDRLLVNQKRITAESESLLREATVTRLIVNEITHWAIIRTGRETHDLQLHLNREQMRDAATLADKLEQVLGAALISGSNATTTTYRSGYGATTRHESLQAILKRMATDLRERDAESGRAPRNDPGAADRRLIATLANCFHGELGDEHRPAILGIVRALGISLDRKSVEAAINQAPRLGG